MATGQHKRMDSVMRHRELGPKICWSSKPSHSRHDERVQRILSFGEIRCRKDAGRDDRRNSKKRKKEDYKAPVKQQSWRNVRARNQEPERETQKASLMPLIKPYQSWLRTAEIEALDGTHAFRKKTEHQTSVILTWPEGKQNWNINALQ